MDDATSEAMGVQFTFLVCDAATGREREFTTVLADDESKTYVEIADEAEERAYAFGRRVFGSSADLEVLSV